MSEVKEWINKEFPTLKVIKWEEIEEAKSPAGKLYKRFMAKRRRLPHNQREPRLAFHGTKARSIHYVRQNGYNKNPSKSTKEQHGSKARAKEVTYFATNPDTAKEYCCAKHKIIVNELLLHGQEGVDHFFTGTKDQSVIGLSNSYCCALPRFIITYE